MAAVSGQRLLGTPSIHGFSLWQRSELFCFLFLKKKKVITGNQHLAGRKSKQPLHREAHGGRNHQLASSASHLMTTLRTTRWGWKLQPDLSSSVYVEQRRAVSNKPWACCRFFSKGLRCMLSLGLGFRTPGSQHGVAVCLQSYSCLSMMLGWSLPFMGKEISRRPHLKP